MHEYDYIIIGGGIAGVTAAETIREHDASGSIVVFENEPYVLYSRVLLPHVLKQKIGREKVFLRTADDFAKKRIDLALSADVRSVDPSRRQVVLAGGEVYTFKKLLIASGGRVTPWGEQADQEYIYHLQTLDDADRLEAALPRIKKPLVIGASFIGLEFAEIFSLRGAAPTLLVRGPHYFSRMVEAEGGDMFRANFERHGITVVANDTVRSIVSAADTLEITTHAPRHLEADAIAVGVGIERDFAFLESSGVTLGKTGVRTNEFFETNCPGIFAAGDVAEFHDTVLDMEHIVGNWTNAVLQGKCAGKNMAGGRVAFRNVPSYSTTNLGFQVTAVGECNDTLDTIVRIDKGMNQYGRLFIRDGVLRGAFFMNRFQDKVACVRLIETRMPIDAYRNQLQGDFRFDIRKIAGIS